MQQFEEAKRKDPGSGPHPLTIQDYRRRNKARQNNHSNTIEQNKVEATTQNTTVSQIAYA